MNLRRKNTIHSYHIHILATNTLFHLYRDLSIIETTHSTISHFRALRLRLSRNPTQTLRNTICQSTIAVSRNNLQFMATRNEMMFKRTRMQTRITIQSDTWNNPTGKDNEDPNMECSTVPYPEHQPPFQEITSTAKRRFPYKRAAPHPRPAATAKPSWKGETDRLLDVQYNLHAAEPVE